MTEREEGRGMYCERCKNNEATVHLTEVIKEVKSEVHLCEGCARDIGLNSKLSDFRLSIPDMLSFLDLNEIDETVQSERCAVCGTGFLDYADSRLLGCDACYMNLKSAIGPVIRRVHGASVHAGKIPSSHNDYRAESPFNKKNIPDYKSIDELRRLLDDAVVDERYEEAALLRDKIRGYGS